MNLWIQELVKEIDDIDKFYMKKLDEYMNKFIMMQAQYLRKI